MIKSIVEAVTIPVMAKVRIGHFVEAQVRHHHFISLIPAQARMYLARTRTHMQKKKSVMSGFTDPPSHRHRLYR